MRNRPNRDADSDRERAIDAFIEGAEEDSPPGQDEAQGQEESGLERGEGGLSSQEKGSPSRDEPEESRAGRTQPAQEGVPKASGEEDHEYPWQAPRVREDVRKGYPLRLPEPLYLKLKFVSQETGRSMNELCNRAVQEIVERELNDLQSRSR